MLEHNRVQESDTDSNEHVITEVRVTRPKEDGSIDASQCLEPDIMKILSCLFR